MQETLKNFYNEIDKLRNFVETNPEYSLSSFLLSSIVKNVPEKTIIDITKDIKQWLDSKK